MGNAASLSPPLLIHMMHPYIYFLISSFSIALQSHNYELSHHKSQLVTEHLLSDSWGSYESCTSSQLKHWLWHTSLPFFSWTHQNKAHLNYMDLQNPTYTSIRHWSATTGLVALSFQYCSLSEQRALVLIHVTQATRESTPRTGDCTEPHCFSF